MRSIAPAGINRLALALLASVALPALASDTPPLRPVRTTPLPGVEGRIDHFAFDSSGQRLFVSALGNNSLEVIDLRKGEVIHSINGLGSPQGVAYLPKVDQIFVASDEGGICRTYDGKSFQQIRQLDLKDDADNVRYDPASDRIYVGFGSGGLAVANGADGKQIGSIKLPGHPEAFVLEKNGNRIFVNVPNAHRVAVVDREKGRMVTTWKTDPASANFPMALDETNHRLFVGCRTPPRLIVLNTDSGEVAARLNLCGDSDDLFYDQKRRRIYATCGAGQIEAIEQADPNTYNQLGKVDTAPGARTGLFVPELDTLFVAIPHRGSQQAEIRAYRVE